MTGLIKATNNINFKCKFKGSRSLLVLRGKTLGINKMDISRLPLEDLKVRVKKSFREKMKKLHPDVPRLTFHRNGDHSSIDFRAVIDAYHFFIDLTSKPEMEEIDDHYPVPWEWTRATETPRGWQDFSPGPC